MTATIIIVFALVVSVVVNVLLFTRKKDKAPRESVRSTILAGIQNVCELATIRERFQSIVMFSEGKKLPFLNVNIPGTTKKFMLKYEGTIVCGCDLSKAKVSEPYAGNKVRITLPQSEILDAYPDIHSYEVYDQSAGIFTSVKLEDQNREVTADLEKVKEHELQSGILEQSNENVRKILASVVAPTGMLADIVFTDEKPELSAAPSHPQLEAALTTE